MFLVNVCMLRSLYLYCLEDAERDVDPSGGGEFGDVRVAAGRARRRLGGVHGQIRLKYVRNTKWNELPGIIERKPESRGFEPTQWYSEV